MSPGCNENIVWLFAAHKSFRHDLTSRSSYHDAFLRPLWDKFPKLDQISSRRDIPTETLRIDAAREVINVAEYEYDPSTLGDFPVSKTILDTPCAAGARSDGLRPHCQQHISHISDPKQRDPGWRPTPDHVSSTKTCQVVRTRARNRSDVKDSVF